MAPQRISWIQTDLLLDMVICFNGAAADRLTLAMLSNTQPPHKHAGLLDGHLRVSELCSSSQCSSPVENKSLFIFLLSASPHRSSGRQGPRQWLCLLSSQHSGLYRHCLGILGLMNETNDNLTINTT